MSPGTTTRPARSRSSAPPAAIGRTVTTEPGYYREPAFSPDGTDDRLSQGLGRFSRNAACGATTRAFTSCRSPRARSPSACRRAARCRSSARTATASSSSTRTATTRCSSRSTSTGADPMTHLKATNAAEFALSPDEQFIGWTERYQAYVMPFVRSGRSIDIAADAKALPQTKVSADAGDYLHWSGDGSTLYWTQGPDLFARRVDLAAFDGAKTGAGRTDRPSRLHRRCAAPDRHDRADQRADRHDERRSGDRGRHGRHQRQPHRRGRPCGKRRHPRRRADDRHERARRSCPASSMRTGTGPTHRTRSSPTRTASITTRSLTA